MVHSLLFCFCDQQEYVHGGQKIRIILGFIVKNFQYERVVLKLTCLSNVSCQDCINFIQSINKLR